MMHIYFLQVNITKYFYYIIAILLKGSFSRPIEQFLCHEECRKLYQLATSWGHIRTNILNFSSTKNKTKSFKNINITTTIHFNKLNS